MSKIGGGGYVNIKTAAAYLGYKSTGPIHQLMKENKLPGYRVGGRGLRFKLADLDALMIPVKDVQPGVGRPRKKKAQTIITTFDLTKGI